MRLLTTLLIATTSLVAAQSPGCKVVPGDATWPTALAWQQELPTAKQQEAKGVQKHATYRIDVKNTDEVVAAIKFANKYNIRLTVLNSGHDFMGRNDAPNGLVIVVDKLKGARISPDYKATTQGVPSVLGNMNVDAIQAQGDAYVTFGVGYNTYSLNRLLAPSKLVTLGPAHEGPAVAGGYGQTGGHSPLSPKFGLAVDYFVEYKVVTADGKLRVANAVSEPDLFWALRGGGGGNWGVVVEATMRAVPTMPTVVAIFTVNTTDYNDRKSIFAPVAYLHSKMPELADHGLTNYYWMYPNAISVTAINVGKEGNKKWMESNWAPILRNMSTFPGMSKSTSSYTSFEYKEFFPFFDEIIVKKKPSTGGLPISLGSLLGGKSSYVDSSLRKRHGPGMEERPSQSSGMRGMDSWFLGKKHLQSPDFTRVLEESMPTGMERPQIRGQCIGGPGIFSRGNGTSANPAWRAGTYVHMIQMGSGDPVNTAIRKLAPEMGAYANEASRFMPGWKKAFWGENYERLSTIKKQYDSEHLFWVTPGINADGWEVKGDRICRSTSAARSAGQASDSPPKTDNPNYVDGTSREWDEFPSSEFMYIQGPRGPTFNPKVLGA